MTSQAYKSTESKYKGGAQDMFVTYDLEQETRGDNTAFYPKVKRVYIAGDVTDWEVGNTTKESGKTVRGVTVTYEQGREGYHRKGFTAERGNTEYEVAPADVKPTKQTFRKVIEIPEKAQNVDFVQEKSQLPEKYKSALQNVK